MNRKWYWIHSLFILFSAILLSTTPALSETLSGSVSSKKEGLMEGVLVNAKKQGGNIMITVVSNAQGKYEFPSERLTPGAYDISVRAVGYKLPVTAVTINAGKPAGLDLTLTEVTDKFELAKQLTNTEWMLSVGKDGDKLGDCVNCHTLERVLFSRYKPDQMAKVVQRMSYHTNNASPEHPWSDTDAAERLAKPPSEEQMELGAFIASINLSAREVWPFELKTLARPKGEDTKVIYTSYILPRRDAAPHDEVLDADGNIWYSDFNSQYFGKLNTKTGEVKDYEVPLRRPNGVAQGGLQIEIDPEGQIWYANMEQIQLVRFDPKTEKMDIFPLPVDEKDAADAHTTMLDPTRMTVDGNLWLNVAGGGDKGGQGAWQLNVASRKFTHVTYPEGSPSAQAYDNLADSQNNLWGFSPGRPHIWRTDAKTLKTEWFPVPGDRKGCRRGHMDSQDRVWCGDFNGNGLIMFNTKTRQYEGDWTAPLPHSRPYDAHYDEKGYDWAGGMDSDLIIRLDVATGKMNQYLLPYRTNIRNVHMQPGAKDALSSLWVGNQHGATITHVEPLKL